MCLSELQAAERGSAAVSDTCFMYSPFTTTSKPPAGIDFRGAFRILNISELHQRNWYLAQYIPAGKTANISFPRFPNNTSFPDTPDTEKGPPHG